ncbi:DedA family protein [Edwardsiella tarda]|uniref:YqaA family protein n=1 Tax=Edwardsiella tarda TaxID=636 RepID=UPI0019689161|nr:YqaA family protein [Edwardsiella tarda]
MSEFWAIAGMFVSSFTSATLLPGNSEVVLSGLLIAAQAPVFGLLAAAIVGNVLGGATNVVIGRALPQVTPQRGLAVALGWLQRYGAAALLLSWLPVIGDLLCVLAGWLRLPWGAVLLYLTLGKAVRYALLAWLTLYGMSWWH